MSSIRHQIFNPKPDGVFPKGKPSANRGAHYKTTHYQDQHDIYVYADIGMYVDYQEPIYTYSQGPKLDRYYTIENNGPREVVTVDADQYRYWRYLNEHPMHPIADRNKVDLSAKLVEIVHNNAHNANNPYVYLRGQQDERVPGTVEIQKMKVNGIRHIYYVITEEGHIDPVFTRNGVKRRVNSANHNQLRCYKRKLEEAKTEDEYREEVKKIKKRKEIEVNPEKLFLDNLPSINNKQNIENNSGADTSNQRLKIKFTFSVSEEDLRKERVLLSEQGLFSPSKIADLKRQAGQIKKNNQLNNKTIVKTDVELKERLKKLQTQASLKKTIQKPKHR